MTLESTLQVDSSNTTPDISINEVDSQNKKYSPEQFYRDLERAQQEEVSIGRDDPRYANRPTDMSEITNMENPIPVQDNPLDEQPVPLNEANEPTLHDDDDEEVNHGPIPKKRFNKEIEKRKLLEEQLNREREERIRMQTQLDMFNKALEEASKPQQAEREIEPIDNDAHQYYLKEINQLKQQVKKQDEHLTIAQQQQQISQALLAQRQAFLQKNPDFDDAYRHVFNAEVQRQELIGYPKEEAMRIADETLMQQAVKALQVGKDVPAMIYNTAKAFGYSGKQASPKAPAPNLNKLQQNIRKSDSILNDIPEAHSKPAPEAATYVTNDGFQRHLMNKDGRGVDPHAFAKALEKLRSGM